jgi:hypothetical protein
MHLQTELIVDASPIGIAGILTQRDGNGRVRIIEYASRPLTHTEQRYSQTEREMLGVVWGCEHFNLYLYGARFQVITDHKPLLGIVRKVTSRPTARLERMCLRLQPYQLELVYKPGIYNEADYLSRHPSGDSSDHKSRIDKQIDFICVNALSDYTNADNGLTIQDIKDSTVQDPVLKEVMRLIASGGEWKKSLGDVFWPYKLVREELSVSSGLVLRGDRIIIPSKLQKKVVQIAHATHQGIVKTKALLRETVWFPGIDKMVENAVKECLPCQAATRFNRPQQTPLKMSKLPSGPWQEVSADFYGPFKTGEYLLVVVDDYSRFPEVEIIHSLSSNTVIPRFDAIFARHGVPKVVRTDNGPPFNGSTFTRWGRSIGFEHRTITPLWPQANAEAERMMDTLGKAIRAAMVEKGSWKQEMYKFLRHYRATPHSTTGVSPAEMLYGRKLRTDLPSIQKQVHFADKMDVVRRRDERMKDYMKQLADARNKAQESEIQIGDRVLVKQKRQDKLDTPFKPKPYEVTQTNGTMVTAENALGKITRNTSYFKKILPSCGKMPEEVEEVLGELPQCTSNSEDSSTSTEAENHTSDNTCMQEQVPTRRSDRVKKSPKYLEEYVPK